MSHNVLLLYHHLAVPYQVNLSMAIGPNMALPWGSHVLNGKTLNK